MRLLLFAAVLKFVCVDPLLSFGEIKCSDWRSGGF